MADTFIHAFEQSGLGKAPFRLVRVEIKRYQACYGAPIQPGGMCKHCGTAIVECCVIRDANGKEFVVGNVCVNKTGDAGLINITKRKVNRLRTEERHKREAERIAAGATLLESPSVREALSKQDHPSGWTGKSLLDWAVWMMAHAGNAGRIQVCKVLEKYQATLA